MNSLPNGLGAKIVGQYGFLDEIDLRTVVQVDPARSILLRFGACRKLVRASLVEETIKRVEAGGDYLRDVSLPSTDPIWLGQTVL